MIGKAVTVTVDRVVGTYHPEHPDYIIQSIMDI
jgi:hypothetical protein